MRGTYWERNTAFQYQRRLGAAATAGTNKRAGPMAPVDPGTGPGPAPCQLRIQLSPGERLISLARSHVRWNK